MIYILSLVLVRAGVDMRTAWCGQRERAQQIIDMTCKLDANKTRRDKRELVWQTRARACSKREKMNVARSVNYKRTEQGVTRERWHGTRD